MAAADPPANRIALCDPYNRRLLMNSNRVYRRLAIVAALTLAIATTAVSAAWGDTSPATSAAATSPCSEVCSGHGYRTAPAPRTGPGSEVIDNGGYGQASVPTSNTAIRAPSVGGGIDWAYVAIGGGIAGLLVLGVGVMHASNRREKSQRPSRLTETHRS
jgi:hypothetical protein